MTRHIANQIASAVTRDLIAVHGAMQQARITGDTAELARLKALYVELLKQTKGG